MANIDMSAKDKAKDVETPPRVQATEVQAPRNTGELATQDKPAAPDPNEGVIDQSYVWLADGSVLRVKNEDLPQGGPMGHWQRGDKVYQIVNIYPVEEKGLVDE